MLHNFNTTLFYLLIYRCFLKINYIQYWLIVRTIAKFYFDIFFSLFKFNKWYICFNFIDHSFFLFVSIKYVELKKKKRRKRKTNSEKNATNYSWSVGHRVFEYFKTSTNKKTFVLLLLNFKKKKKNRKCFRQFVTGKKKNLFFDSIPNFGPWYHVFRNFNSGIAATLQHFRERWRFQERDFRECLYDDHVRTVGVRTREIISRRSKRVNDLRGGKFLCAASFVPNYSSLGRTQSNAPSGGSFHSTGTTECYRSLWRLLLKISILFYPSCKNVSFVSYSFRVDHEILTANELYSIPNFNKRCTEISRSRKVIVLSEWKFRFSI